MSRARISAFAILCGFLFLSTTAGTGFFVESGDFAFAENVSIDGSDFTFITNMFEVLVFVIAGVIAGVIFSMESLVLTLLFRLIAVRKNSIIQKHEYDVSKKIILYTALGSLLLQLLIFRFRWWFVAVILHLIVGIVIFLVYFTELEHHAKTAEQSENYKDLYQ